MSTPKPGPPKLDRQVHGAVRQILYNELGFGPQKLKRFLSQAFEAELRRQAGVMAGPLQRELREEYEVQLARLKKEIEELQGRVNELRMSKVVAEVEALNAFRARLIEAAANVPLDLEFQRLFIDQLLDRSPTGNILKPLVQSALERAAKEAVDEFVASNFRTDVTLKPGRKIFLPAHELRNRTED